MPQNVFQNSVNPFSQWLTICSQKAQNYVYFLPNDFVQISKCHQHAVKMLIKIMYEDTFIDF